MTNKEKFLQLVSEEKVETINRFKEQIKNELMLKESQKIAIKVLNKLRELKWTQKDLATKLNVSAQQISKVVSGKENLTIETLIKLQNILDIPILATFYERYSDNQFKIKKSYIKLDYERKANGVIEYNNSNTTEKDFQSINDFTFPDHLQTA